jgi:hypothetical protein
MILFTTTAPFVEAFPLAEDFQSIERFEQAEFAAHPPERTSFLRPLTPYEQREHSAILEGQPARFAVMVTRTGCGGVSRNFGLINSADALGLFEREPNEATK